MTSISRYFLPLVAFYMLASCGNNGFNAAKLEDAPRDSKFEQSVVINEVMASNQSGLLTSEGKVCDWIEIKNLTNSEVSLSGYKLLYSKEKAVAADSTATADSTLQKPDTLKTEKKEKKHKKNKGETVVNDSIEKKFITWTFPEETTIKPGECLVVFTSSKAPEQPATELHADIKLSRKGCLKLISNKTTVLSEMQYDNLHSDQVIRRLNGEECEYSFYPTPGFDNDNEGYEAYQALIEKQRTSPLRIWRLFSRCGEKDCNWVTLKNTSSQPVELSQYSLTDKASKPGKWTFPAETLAPGATRQVLFIGKGAVQPSPNKASFKLDDDQVVVLTKGGKFVDGVSGYTTLPNTVIGRRDNGTGFYYFNKSEAATTATTAAARAAADTTAVDNVKCYRFITAKPVFDQAPGVYSDVKTMAVTINTGGRKVHYTTDGSIPTMDSKVYADSIRIDSITTIRAFAEGDDNSMRSGVTTCTYFLGVKHTLPVINITVSNSDLFDFNTGIYATGPGARPAFPHVGANYWKAWEKRAHVELYDGNSGFETDCGLRIFGGFSRAREKKSFRIIFRGCYGEKSVSYDYFDKGKDEKLDQFVLRSGSQDDERVMVRDEFFTSLMAEHSPSLLVQAYRPVALYLNGKYWGLYYIREKINKDFVARHLGVSNDSITIIMSKYLEKGTWTDFRAVQNYVNTHNMTLQSSYDYMNQHIDIPGLIDHFIGELYTSNTDVGNVRYVYSPDPKGDQKWHWVYYDLDSSWAGYKTMNSYLNVNRDLCLQAGFTAALLRNATFRKQFLERTSYHLHNTLSQKNAEAVFDALVAKIRPEMVNNCKRWPGLSFETWEKNAATFRSHFATKPKTILDDIRGYLNVTPAEEKLYFSDLGY